MLANGLPRPVRLIAERCPPSQPPGKDRPQPGRHKGKKPDIQKVIEYRNHLLHKRIRIGWARRSEERRVGKEGRARRWSENSSRRRHTRLTCDWSSDVCSSDLYARQRPAPARKTDRRTLPTIPTTG